MAVAGFHYERLLVYVVDVICQSCRNVCASNDRYVRRNLSAKRAVFLCGQLIGGVIASLFAHWLKGEPLLIGNK